MHPWNRIGCIILVFMFLFAEALESFQQLLAHEKALKKSARAKSDVHLPCFHFSVSKRLNQFA
jgi:hypothetical protein